MAGGQEYTKHQRGIINRYYEHLDTIALQKLGEIVSDLYLAEGSQATRLWNSARQALAKLAPPDDPHVMKVLSVRSVAGLAKLVTDLNAQASTRPKSTTAPQQGEDELDPAHRAPAPSSMPASHAPAAHHPSTAVHAAASVQTPASAPPTPDQLKSAMKAFRKRLKLTRLDEESKLGRSPMSAGKHSQVLAIMPPREYPREVWEELVRQGKLKSAGGSFYQLADESGS